MTLYKRIIQLLNEQKIKFFFYYDIIYTIIISQSVIRYENKLFQL